MSVHQYHTHTRSLQVLLAHTCAEGESSQQSEPLGGVFAVVRREHQSADEAEGGERRQQTARQQPRVQVHRAAGAGQQRRDRHRRVHILQVRPNRRLPVNTETQQVTTH